MRYVLVFFQETETTQGKQSQKDKDQIKNVCLKWKCSYVMGKHQVRQGILELKRKHVNHCSGISSFFVNKVSK